MRRVCSLIVPVCCSLLVRSFSLSQVDSVRIVQDTTIGVPSTAADSLRRENPTARRITIDTTAYHPTKNPWRAVGLSAAVPGLGQIYVGNYWKVPVILGLGGYWISEWIKLNGKYKDYRDLFSQSVTPSLPSGNGQYQRYRDFYRDERDKFAWYLGALYMLNLVDAYVGANLYDFDVGSDLGMDGRMKLRVTAEVRIKF